MEIVVLGAAILIATLYLASKFGNGDAKGKGTSPTGGGSSPTQSGTTLGGECGTCCSSVGTEKFNPISATFKPINNNSFGDAGRTGATNTWARWSGRNKANPGISGRAPYGTAAAPKSKRQLQKTTLGGTSTHHHGLGIGPHGHGIGVIPAAIGGPHGVKSTPASVLKPVATTRGSGVAQHLPAQSGPTLVPHTFCLTCFATWVIVGSLVFIGLMVSVTKG